MTHSLSYFRTKGNHWSKGQEALRKRWSFKQDSLNLFTPKRCSGLRVNVEWLSGWQAHPEIHLVSETQLCISSSAGWQLRSWKLNTVQSLELRRQEVGTGISGCHLSWASQSLARWHIGPRPSQTQGHALWRAWPAVRAAARGMLCGKQERTKSATFSTTAMDLNDAMTFSSIS